jgi:ribosomal protein S17E
MKFSEKSTFLPKNRDLVFKLFFHNFDFDFECNKRLVPQFNSCASSSQNLDINDQF